MSVWNSVLRWVARLSSLLVAGTFFMILASEIISPHSGAPNNFREWAGIGLMILASIAMLLAWRWEMTGALLSLASVGILIVLIRIHSVPYVFLIMAIPGVLFAADWLSRKGFSTRHHA